jgi:hypothetical protein
MSQLKKCLQVPEEQLPMEELYLGRDLTYREKPVKILGTAERVTRSKVIKQARSSGVTTPRLKSSGTMKKSSDQIILNYF